MKRWEEGEMEETEPSAKRACLDDAVVLLDEDATDVDPTPAVDLSPSSPVPLDQHKDVQVIKGSIEDIIFIQSQHLLPFRRKLLALELSLLQSKEESWILLSNLQLTSLQVRNSYIQM